MTHLRDFLQILLNDPNESYRDIICWRDRSQGIFKIIEPPRLADLWGQQKNLTGMTYDKLARALRNYYKSNKLQKVTGQRHVYQFIFSDKNPPLSKSKMRLLIEQNNQLKTNSYACHTGKQDCDILLGYQNPQRNDNNGTNNVLTDGVDVDGAVPFHPVSNPLFEVEENFYIKKEDLR